MFAVDPVRQTLTSTAFAMTSTTALAPSMPVVSVMGQAPSTIADVRTFQQVTATVTATNWMLQAFAVVTALRMSTKTVCV